MRDPQGCRLSVAFWLLAALAGCKTTGAQGGGATCSVQVMLSAAEQVNPDRQGRALPTLVRLYQLRATTRLAEASFEAIWERDREILADDLLDSREATVYPGEEQVQRFPLSPGARHLVAVAIFREPSGEAWRAAVPLDPRDCSDDEPLGPFFIHLEGAQLHVLESAPQKVSSRVRHGGVSLAHPR